MCSADYLPYLEVIIKKVILNRTNLYRILQKTYVTPVLMFYITITSHTHKLVMMSLRQNSFFFLLKRTSFKLNTDY